MKNSLKAALLSGFIFPGLGHLVVKQFRTGIILILTTTIGVIVTIAGAVTTALAILEKIEAEDLPITMETITSAVHQAMASSGNVVLNAGLIFLSLCWIVGVVDAYRVGSSIDGQK